MVDSVKVGGLVYEVSLVKDLQLEEREPDLLGRIDYLGVKIKVEEALAEQMQHQVFIHELTHGLLTESGFTDHTEEQADRIGKVLYQILADNDFSFIRKAW